MKKILMRHNKWDIFIHWFNVICWFLLLPTGIGLIKHELINPLGDWWPSMMRDLFGGAGNLLLFHEVVGVIWILGFVVYLVFNFKGALFFLSEIFSVDFKRDLSWLAKKPFVMVFGPKFLERLGLSPELPPQGFYNMGQKAFAQPAVLGGGVIACTGIIMLLSNLVLDNSRTVFVSWSIMLHYLAAGLILAGLFVHIYMAALVPEERPAFFSMFRGYVPTEHAKHHNRLWYEREMQIKGE